MKTFKTIMKEENLPSQVRVKANADLIKAGLDGNKPYEKVGLALKDVTSVLDKHGIEVVDSFDANLFMPDPNGKAINRKFDVAFTNADDSFSPKDISNSLLVISFAKLQSGRFEVLAYLS